MVIEILQIENTNAVDFKIEIRAEFNEALENHKKTTQINDEETLVSRQEAASLFGVSLVTIWDWQRKNIIFGYRIGNKILFKKSELLNSLKKTNNFKNQSIK